MSDTAAPGTIVSTSTTYVLQMRLGVSRSWGDSSYPPFDTKRAAEQVRHDCFDPDESRIVVRTITDALA